TADVSPDMSGIPGPPPVEAVAANQEPASDPSPVPIPPPAHHKKRHHVHPAVAKVEETQAQPPQAQPVQAPPPQVQQQAQAAPPVTAPPVPTETTHALPPREPA